MQARSHLPLRAGLAGLLSLGLFLVSFAAGQEPPARKKQIAEVEKKIDELTKRLNDLKKNGTTAATGEFKPDWLRALSWRAIGPANMSGRVVALSVFEKDPTTYWVATASGGLLKTTNNGITFEHQFDREATVSIGDVCVAPSDRNVVYVGTGENNPRNSVSWGDGVYKSADGGKTWKNVGLNKTFQIGKVIVHPTNPEIVYVGALGRLYGPNEDRGVYKTADGGKTWQKILYVDDKTGVQDMRMHPADPETLIVATWERQRDGHDGFFGNFTGDQYGPIKNHAPGAALFKTTDGGRSFKKLTRGLPTVKLGRVGLDWYLKDPNIVYAIIDTEKVGTTTAAYVGIQGEKSDQGLKLTQVTENGPAAKAGLKRGDTLVSFAGKPVKELPELAKILDAHVAGDKVKATVLQEVEKKDPDKKEADKKETTKKEVEIVLGPRPAAGGAGGGAGSLLLPGFFATDEEQGFRVTRMLGNAAENAGIKDGELVVEVEGKPARGFRETFQALTESKKAGDKVKLTLDRAGKKETVEVALAAPQFGGGGPGGGRGPGGGGGPGAGAGASTRPFSTTLGGQRENVQDQQGRDGFQTGGVFRSSDAGETWERINSLNPRPMYFSQIRVDPSDNKYLYVLGVSMAMSSDGGKTFRSTGGGIHADQHALWINPRDGRHLVVGCDGGYYVTYDRTANWDHLNHAALGQFYHVAVDNRRAYKVYGGLQDNGSWGGPSVVRSGTGPINEDWFSVGSGDGFVCRVDPNDPDLIYSTSQNGNMSRRNLRTGETAAIRPRAPGAQGPGGRGPGGGGQGQQPPGQPGQQPAGGRASPYRFNWNTPFILSNHNSKIFYAAGNFVFQSLDRGNDLRVISPEITRTPQGTATALAESPLNPKVLYVGTDDGLIHVTRDGGNTWKKVGPSGLPGPRWVATLEPSRFAEGRCYVAFDGHRSDDDDPYAYVTEDFGETWKSLRANLPEGSTRVLREDIQNADLLYLGTEFAVFASVDRGRSWVKINNNLPTVAVHEIAQHPTSGEIVAATHGRSIWIADVTVLRQMTPATVKAPTHLFKPNNVVRWKTEPARGRTNRRFVGTNPTRNAEIYYTLTTRAEKVSLKILDAEGRVVRELPGGSTPGTEGSDARSPGIHKVTWNLATAAPNQPAGQGAQAGAGGGGRRGGAGAQAGGQRGGGAGQRGGAGQAQRPAQAQAGGAQAPAGQQQQPQPGAGPAGRQGGGGGGGGGFGGAGGPGGFGGAMVQPGTYRVVLTVDGEEYSQTFKVEADPSGPAVDTVTEEDEEEE